MSLAHVSYLTADVHLHESICLENASCLILKHLHCVGCVKTDQY